MVVLGPECELLGSEGHAKRSGRASDDNISAGGEVVVKSRPFGRFLPTRRDVGKKAPEHPIHHTDHELLRLAM